MCAAETLNISSNAISYLPKFVFAALPMLAVMDISDNPILYVTPGVFNHIEHLLNISTTNQGLCCFMQHTVRCKSSAPQKRRLCKRLVSRKLIGTFATFPAAVVLIFNILAFFITARSSKRANRIFLYLPIMDAALAIYLLILVGYDYTFGKSFILVNRVWLQGVECHVLQAISSLSISGSSMSILMIVIEWFSAIYFPFKVESIAESLYRFSDIYLFWPISFTFLRSRFLAIADDLCFPYHPSGNNNLLLYMTLFTAESCVFVLTVTQTVLIVHRVGQSRRDANRKWSTNDRRLLHRLAVISINSLMRWACLMIETYFGLISSNGNTSATEYIVFFILPINSVVTPVVFTLSTSKFRHRKSSIDKPSSRFFSKETQ